MYGICFLLRNSAANNTMPTGRNQPLRCMQGLMHRVAQACCSCAKDGFVFYALYWILPVPEKFQLPELLHKTVFTGILLWLRLI